MDNISGQAASGGTVNVHVGVGPSEADMRGFLETSAALNPQVWLMTLKCADLAELACLAPIQNVDPFGRKILPRISSGIHLLGECE